MNSKQRIVILSLCTSLGFIFALFFQVPWKQWIADIYIDRLMAKCQNSVPSPTLCMDDEVVALTNVLPMASVYELVKYIQNRFPEYLTCHGLGHRLGEKQLAKRSADWVGAFLSCPLDMCSYGCGHGVIQKQFKSAILTQLQIDEAIPVLAAACEPKKGWSPTYISSRTCMHSIGHITFYITGGDVQRAVEVCRSIGDQGNPERDFGSCLSGLFMQVFLPYDPDAIALSKQITPPKEQVHTYCSQFDTEVREKCLEESWPLFVDEVQNPQGIEDFCRLFGPLGQEATCVHRVAAELILVNHGNASFVKSTCLGLKPEFVAACFSGVATSMLVYDSQLIQQSLAVCTVAREYNESVGMECYERVFQTGYGWFEHSSDKYKEFCNSLPQSLKIRCKKA